jgi:predicted O-methyltransferase YrrM
LNVFYSIFAYIGFYFQAKTIYQIHSPLIYSILHKCITNKRYYYIFDDTVLLYHSLLQNENIIELQDFGAGSRVNAPTTIKSIAATATSKPAKAQQLFRLVYFLKPKSILELGTNLGISTLHLAAVDSTAAVHTCEGDPNLLAIAKSHFEKLGLKNITSYLGNFDTILPTVLQGIRSPIDFVYLDGNHRKAATLAYFEMILEQCATTCTFVIDDIYWSADMQSAWQAIIQHPSVTHSLNLFQYGIVIVNKARMQPTHHVTYIAHRYKPWRIGFFK